MRLSVLFLFLFVALCSASAEETKPAATPVPISITETWVDGGRNPASTPSPAPSPAPSPGPSVLPDEIFTHAGLRDRIWVEVANLAEAVQKDKINPRDLVLYLNGQEVKNNKPVAIKGPTQNWLGFDLV